MSINTVEPRIQRSFKTISDKVAFDLDQIFMPELVGGDSLTWNELLLSKRVLIISEAGAGKTYECREECRRLLGEGEVAFYFELAELSRNHPRELMSHEEELAFDEWLVAQCGEATVFLDSIDELKLASGSLETALKQLNKLFKGQLDRARFVVTTRPATVDEQLIRQYLPTQSREEVEVIGEDEFADIAMGKRQERDNTKDRKPPEWQKVALEPLSTEQIEQFAINQGVTDVGALLDDIKKRNAADFVRRPQDLMELCVDWCAHHRIRTHMEQVASNIDVKLKPRVSRREKAELSKEKAISGAENLALAAMLTGKLSFTYNAALMTSGSRDSVLNTEAILTDWTASEIETLLERGIFGFASYGCVRFHHRSVVEYLAARSLNGLIEKGMTLKAVKRLLFSTDIRGKKVLKPSLRPISAWLSHFQSYIFSEVCEREPSVLFEYADPESFNTVQKIQILNSYISHFGKGGWRGLHVQKEQVQRFSSNGLSSEVIRLWNSGVENPDVRELLLEIMASASMVDCRDIAYNVYTNHEVGLGERKDALDVLINTNDERISHVLKAIDEEPDIWNATIIEDLIVSLFPEKIPVKNLCSLLPLVKYSKNTVSSLNWFWPNALQELDIESGYLDDLRDGLVDLIKKTSNWDEKKWPRLTTGMSNLIEPLASICIRQLRTGNKKKQLVHACVVAIRTNEYDTHYDKDYVKKLVEWIEKAPPLLREALFWADDDFIQNYSPESDPWKRLCELNHRGVVSLRTKDSWVKNNLSNIKFPLEKRKIMFEAIVHFMRGSDEGREEYISSLKQYVLDSEYFLSKIKTLLEPPKIDPELERMEKEDRRRANKYKKKQEKNRAIWISLWRDIVNNPDEVLSDSKIENTVWYIYKVMKKTEGNELSSEWNRKFLESTFDKRVTDIIRKELMKFWRQEKDKPTLRSERSLEEKNTTWSHWYMGLAGIYAESEDPEWIKHISYDEAKLALRYAPVELNKLPEWVSSLAEEFPGAVDEILGKELSEGLCELAVQGYYTPFLQDISHTDPAVAILFLPRLKSWLRENASVVKEGEERAQVECRLDGVVEIILKFGSEEYLTFLHETAVSLAKETENDFFSTIWLPILMNVNPSAGLEKLKSLVGAIQPSKNSEAVKLIAHLFGDWPEQRRVNLSDEKFTPELLLSLVRLAYYHIDVDDDMDRAGGSYRPGPRDHAQRARSAILDAIFSKSGKDAWRAKIEISNDPILKDCKDRMLRIARESAAIELDKNKFTESNVCDFLFSKEPLILTTEDMFQVLIDQLDELEDSLLRDDSPRELWSTIQKEKLMRREVSAKLNIKSKGVYTVDQESVTADENETDIRLRSTTSDHQAVLELKLGEKYSGRQLRDTIKNQLVSKYMAPENCRSGCLLITISKNRHWDHPEIGEYLDVQELQDFLDSEAKAVSSSMMGINIVVRILDLTPRLIRKERLLEEGILND